MAVIAQSSEQRDLRSTTLLTAALVLVAVTMTFGAMIAVFIYRSEGNKYWGHVQIPSLLYFSTALLLLSSGTLEHARRQLSQHFPLSEEDQRAAFQGIALTTALSILFLLAQTGAWVQVLHSGIVLAKNPHSWFIFLFVALHGLHILLGLGGLAYLCMRTREPASGPRYQMKTRALTQGISIFWHYLDFIWIVLFVLLLVWRR